MLTVDYCESKLEQLSAAIIRSQDRSQEDEISHLRRLKKAYLKELRKAEKRPRKTKPEGETRARYGAYYRKGIEKKAHVVRGY